MRNKTLAQLVMSRARGEETAIRDQVTMDDLKKVLKDRLEIKALLEAASEKSENLLQPLTYLKEVGLDLSGITQGMKNVAEVYKDLAAQEHEARRAAEQEARENRNLAEQTQAQVLQLLVTNFLQEQQRLISDMVQKLEKLTDRQVKEPDPITKTLQEGVAALLAGQLQAALSPESKRSRLEELVEDLKLIQTLVDLLKIRREEIPIRTDNERLALEVMKLQLEDERERERIRREQELEERKLHALEKGASLLKENLGDLLRALAETSATIRKRMPRPTVRPVRQPVTQQPQGN